MNKAELINITEHAIAKEFFNNIELLDSCKNSLKEMIDNAVIDAANKGKYSTSINLHLVSDEYYKILQNTSLENELIDYAKQYLAKLELKYKIGNSYFNGRFIDIEWRE